MKSLLYLSARLERRNWHTPSRFLSSAYGLTSMKLIFFGTSDFSKPIFEVLKKDGYSPILWNPQGTFEEFKKIKPDICIAAAYGKIIPKEWLEIPKYGFLNIHPSLLPKYRGPSPIQAVILNGDQETGVTIILMDEKVDHGEIIASVSYQISLLENYSMSEVKLAELGAKLLIETLPKWINGKIKPIEQDHKEATYTKKFSWQDGKIDWSKSADEIGRQIRALNPEPGVWTNWNGKILKILEVLPTQDENDNIFTGRVFITENEDAAIKCGFQSDILLKTVQLEGKKPMGIEDFLNGHKNFIGSTLTSNI